MRDTAVSRRRHMDWCSSPFSTGGENKARLGDFAANICSALTGEAKNSLLEQLQRNSILNEISTDQLSNQMNDYEVLTYYETRMTKLIIRKRR